MREEEYGVVQCSEYKVDYDSDTVIAHRKED
jgi:hypothetical protein